MWDIENCCQYFEVLFQLSQWIYAFQNKIKVLLNTFNKQFTNKLNLFTTVLLKYQLTVILHIHSNEVYHYEVFIMISIEGFLL